MSHALVLCAGASTRMGEPKALCRLGDMTILERILRTLTVASIVAPRIIVAAPHGKAILAWLREQHIDGPQIVWNPHPEDGMLSSIQCGLATLPQHASGTLLWPVDIPLISASTLTALLDRDPERLVLPTFGGRGGHPVWLPAARFGDVRELPRTSSLRMLRERHPALRVAVHDPEVVHDLDTPEALAQAELRLRR